MRQLLFTVMTKLSTIDVEARRVLGRMPEPQMQALRASLVVLCEAHWPKMRGPEPTTRMAKALWEMPPHLADLFVHLYGIVDPCLGEILDRLRPPQALALLVLAELDRGDAEGARSAYTAMRLFESPAARRAFVHAALAASGRQAPEAWLRHAHRPALWRAVVGFAVQTGRWDMKAVLEGLKQVAQTQASPNGVADGSDMQPILDMLRELGVTFISVEADRIRYTLRGEEQEPVRCKQLVDMLAEGRQAR